MSEKTIDAIVDGGKATPGPPLGPALGPLGVNAGQVIAEINKVTSAFAGMKVPVRVIVDTATKAFQIEVGAPATSELIKKEAKIEKGSGAKETVAGNLPLKTAIEIARKKKSMAINIKSAVKEVLGTCKSMNLHVEGKDARVIIREINEGKHDSLMG